MGGSHGLAATNTAVLLLDMSSPWPSGQGAELFVSGRGFDPRRRDPMVSGRLLGWLSHGRLSSFTSWDIYSFGFRRTYYIPRYTSLDTRETI